MNDTSIQSLDSFDSAAAEELGYLGHNPARACVADNRFSYNLYIPREYFNNDRPISLIVLVHSSYRNSYALSNAFASFAEERNCALLAPLFPIGLGDPQDTSNYKALRYRDIRYDHILLSMADEVKARFARVQTRKFFLYGFSGGGQFVHRFAYLHASRLLGLVCGAPGSQTRLDDTRPFPEGVSDLKQVFGQALQWDELKHVPTMFICGDADTDTKYITLWGVTPTADLLQGRRYGLFRLEASWKKAGANCHVFTVPGVGHEEPHMWEPTQNFLKKLLGA